MSPDASNVLSIFEYFREKRREKAVEHLCQAYEAHLRAEKEVLKALIQMGKDEEKDLMTEQETAYAAILEQRAKSIQQSGKRIWKIMHGMANNSPIKDLLAEEFRNFPTEVQTDSSDSSDSSD